jgi:hypothetical protein
VQKVGRIDSNLYNLDQFEIPSKVSARTECLLVRVLLGDGLDGDGYGVKWEIADHSPRFLFVSHAL